MADRRADDTPLAPHRSLSGVSQEERGSSSAQPVTTEASPRASSSAPGRDSRSGSEPTGSGSGAAAVQSGGPTGSSTGATSVTAQAPARPTASQTRPRGTRRARLRLVHLDPWSVMKTAFLLSIAFGIVTVVAVAVVWSVLSAAGVWDSINKTVTDVLGGDSAQNFDVKNYVGTSRVLGFTMIVAALDVLLITAISTLAAFLYNLAAALLGGIDVTLAEDER